MVARVVAEMRNLWSDEKTTVAKLLGEDAEDEGDLEDHTDRIAAAADAEAAAWWAANDPTLRDEATQPNDDEEKP